MTKLADKVAWEHKTITLARSNEVVVLAVLGVEPKTMRQICQETGLGEYQVSLTTTHLCGRHLARRHSAPSRNGWQYSFNLTGRGRAWLREQGVEPC